MDLNSILEARDRIRPFVKETPLVHSEWLSRRTGANVYLKLENVHEIGAFKIRGAASKFTSLSRTQLKRGVVTASNGNHGCAVAFVGQKLGVPVEVFASSAILRMMAEKIEGYGATLTEVDGEAIDAARAGREKARTAGCTYFPPYNDPEVVAGQGTVAVEIHQDLPSIDAVFVAVGGGGLIGGIGTYLSERSPQTEIVGCWPHNSPALYYGLLHDRIEEVQVKPTLSTSTAGNLEPETITLDICKQVITRTVLVDEEQIMRALHILYRHHDQLVEGAAGVAVAAFTEVAHHYSGKDVAIIICGGNVDASLARRIVDFAV